MGFNNFRFQIIWRIFWLMATIVLALRLWAHAQYYITAFTLGLSALVQLVLLVRYAEQATTLFSRFLSGIQYDDFSQNYQLAGMGHRFEALSQEFERVMQKFQEIRAEKEAQYHYLDTIVQHIAIGLLVYDEQGQIRLFNEAAQQLLGIKRLRHLTQLQKTHPDLLLQLENPEPSAGRWSNSYRTTALFTWQCAGRPLPCARKISASFPGKTSKPNLMTKRWRPGKT
ncbi:MAG: PAS domain-containing protein [Microscillaceae bacterium]|nr:PAS domain-containing protein [Microscillaceae bacterium]